MNYSINIDRFLKQFNAEYSFLYENNDAVPGYDEAVDAFCLFLNDHFDFVCEFAKYRGDVVSSDREAAAFMFALDTAQREAEALERFHLGDEVTISYQGKPTAGVIIDRPDPGYFKIEFQVGMHLMTCWRRVTDVDPIAMYEEYCRAC